MRKPDFESLKAGDAWTPLAMAARQLWQVALGLCCLAIALGCDLVAPKPEAREIPITMWKAASDVTPAWSHDGRWIAYHRRYPTTDGPPGVYLIAVAGGAPRLVTAGDYSGP